jgi:hypothetical protein
MNRNCRIREEESAQIQNESGGNSVMAWIIYEVKIFIDDAFVPSGFPCSNPGTGRRFEHNWLA